MVLWSDVVVADYNYFFDTSAVLYSQTMNNAWQVGVLVDESHNLLERARNMYSAELNEYDLQALQQSAPIVLKKTLASLARSWRHTYRDQTAVYQAYTEIPAKFLAALLRASSDITDYLAAHAQQAPGPLERF